MRACTAPTSTPSLTPNMQALEKQLERVDGALEENQDRIGIMGEHLQNVQQELKYTQGRVGGGG